MDTNKTGVDERLEEQTNLEAIPTSEEPDASQTQAEENISAEELEKLPEEEAKKREAFIRQRQLIREQKAKLQQLEEERQRILEEQSRLNEIRNIGYQPPAEPITPETDVNAITSRLTASERIAYESAQRVAELEKRLEDERLYREVPELNPQSEEYKKPETKVLEEYVAGQYLLQALEGKKPDIVKIAKAAKEKFLNATSSQKEQIAQSTVEKLRKAEQASLEARGSSVVQPQKPNLDDLRYRARRGDPDAMAELLKHTVLSEE